MSRITRYYDASRKSVLWTGGVVGVANTVAELLPQSRLEFPLVFDHVGNGATAFAASAVMAFVLSKSVRTDIQSEFEDLDPITPDSYAQRVSAGSFAVGMVVNAATEVITVPDAKDVVFGVAGAALGAYIVSQTEYNRHFIEDDQASEA